MNTYIKYERISRSIKEDEINEFFRKIIIEGNDLLFYKEEIKEYGVIDIVVVVGKKRIVL